MPFEALLVVVAPSLCWTGLMPLAAASASRSARMVAIMSVSFGVMCEAAGSLRQEPRRVKAARVV